MLPDSNAKPASRLDPGEAWTVLTEAPLKGLGLAREAGVVFAWDETDRLYLLDLKGQLRSVARAPGKVVLAAISDDGSRIAIVGDGGRFWLLDPDLALVFERRAPPDPLALAIDPHGRYVAISSKMSTNHFYTGSGKPAGKFETHQPLAFLAFVPTRPLLIGAAAYGMLMALELSPGDGDHLDASPVWQERQVSGIGRLATTGDASMILTSCFTHGVQRFDVHGANDGAYHLGGTATQAVPDFAGRIIAVSTLEGELVLLNSGGNVRWKTGLPRPALALEADPLGRYLIYGQATGEIVRLDLYAEAPGRSPGDPRTSAASSSHAGPSKPSRPIPLDPKMAASAGSLRKPDWSFPAAANEDQAASGVVAVLDDPPRVGLLMSNLRLQLFSTDGQNLGFAPDIQGVGRILRTSNGWIAAATDRQIVLFHAPRNAAQRVDLSLVEITQLAIRPDTFGLAVVQERDRIGRATLAGRWVWKQELKTPVEDVAIGPDGYSAFSNEDGALTVYDPAGLTAGVYRTEPAEPLLLIEAVDDAPAGVVWMTLARNSQVLRGHDLRGKVLWESPVAFEGWRFQRISSLAMIAAPDGRVLAFDGAGHLRGQARASDGARDHYGVSEDGQPRRITRQGVHLICADFDGRVRWRAVCEEPLGPVAVGRAGVAAMIGRSLTWFAGLG